MFDQLVAGDPAGSVRLTVDVDVVTGHCTHHLTTGTPQATIVSVEKQQETNNGQQKPPPRPYALRHPTGQAGGRIRGPVPHHCPYNRNYCGIRFDYLNQQFCYGEVWDGHYLNEPTLVFVSRGATPKTLFLVVIRHE